MDSRKIGKAPTNDMGTYTGGCHCGAIKYSLTMPRPTPADPIDAIRYPAAHFRLLAPADTAAMGNYQPNSKTFNKYFCTACGVHVYMTGSYEVYGTKYEHFTVNVGTLDQPQAGLDLNDVKIGYVDMLHNNYTGGKKDVPWPCGLV